MGSKMNPAIFDCYESALPDEPIFVLLGRDTDAPYVIRMWAGKRWQDLAAGKRPQSDKFVIEEARLCAIEMEKWRKENDGKWRK